MMEQGRQAGVFVEAEQDIIQRVFASATAPSRL
jgi:hypothetical protein